MTVYRIFQKVTVESKKAPDGRCLMEEESENFVVEEWACDAPFGEALNGIIAEPNHVCDWLDEGEIQFDEDVEYQADGPDDAGCFDGSNHDA